MTDYCNHDLVGAHHLRHDTHALEIIFDIMKSYPNGDQVPGLWITSPIHDDQGNLLGRTYSLPYPLPSFVDEFYPGMDPDDSNGEIALYYGGTYYDEAMPCTDPADHELRVGCFRAAELLYRHSAGKGNAVANLCLGYVYSYDRCEGQYWVDPLDFKTQQEYWNYSYPREERAYECLKLAAEADICEACYKLGDMCKHGTGCEPDVAEAFRWYLRASELSAYQRPVILGSVALRLAGSYEEGLGCPQDFNRAMKWYQQAAAGLEVAFDNGETWYEKALSRAKAGIKRCQQEA